MIVVKIKKKKAQKVYHRQILKFEGYKYYLEPTPLENKIKQLGKIKLMWKNHKEFMKNK